MNLLITILVGLIAGWLTGLAMKGSGYGVAGDIILGIIGSLIGTFIFRLLGFTATGILSSLIVAIIGAIILVYIVRLIKGQYPTS